MKIKKLTYLVVITCFILTNCKKEVKKETLPVDKQEVTLAISGMTCEIGCAKTIQSKLTKKEGVLNAKVIFKDSIANIKFDANTTSKNDLIAFVDGIAGGDMYKASETSKEVFKKHDCSDDCKEKCEAKKENNMKKDCKEDCKMACCKDKATK